ncbi:hypothetical protein MIR68_008131 [Amoeboaphelidium protococcarum]|nr:hypothetical protein MIR68_008131 [Amoeboaphelidium protococcarum]
MHKEEQERKRQRRLTLESQNPSKKKAAEYLVDLKSQFQQEQQRKKTGEVDTSLTTSKVRARRQSSHDPTNVSGKFYDGGRVDSLYGRMADAELKIGDQNANKRKFHRQSLDATEQRYKMDQIAQIRSDLEEVKKDQEITRKRESELEQGLVKLHLDHFPYGKDHLVPKSGKHAWTHKGNDPEDVLEIRRQQREQYQRELSQFDREQKLQQSKREAEERQKTNQHLETDYWKWNRDELRKATKPRQAHAISPEQLELRHNLDSQVASQRENHQRDIQHDRSYSTEHYENHFVNKMGAGGRVQSPTLKSFTRTFEEADNERPYSPHSRPPANLKLNSFSKDFYTHTDHDKHRNRRDNMKDLMMHE